MNDDSNTRTASISEHIIAFDFGLKYIGSAIGTLQTGLAQPLQTLRCKSGQPDWIEIGKLIQTWHPSRLIVGRPEPNSPAELLKNLDSFLVQLQQRFHLPVEQISEYLSSSEAYHQLKTKREAGERGKIARADIDKVAAAFILESWFLTQTETNK